MEDRGIDATKPSDAPKVTLEINGVRVEVDRKFLDLPREKQQKVVESIASDIDRQSGIMGQVNKGIAQGIGGFVDLINPFDNPAWENVAGGRFKMGSAEKGLERAMRSIGANVAVREPEGFVEGLGRGVGLAASTLPGVIGAAGRARAIEGVAGKIADDVFRGLVAKRGAATDIAAGGISVGAAEAAKEAGYPEAAQIAAGIAAPVAAIPAAGAAIRGAGRVATSTPGMRLVAKGAESIKRAVVPMSEPGARAVVRNRLIELAGGEDRARDLAGKIRAGDEIGLTPAQQTGDPNLIGLERAAAAENPVLRERLRERALASRAAAEEEIAGMGGSVGDARKFFNSRLNAFQKRLDQRVRRVVGRADEGIEAQSPGRSEPSISETAVKKLKDELDRAVREERVLWSKIPEDEMVSTAKAKATVSEILDKTPWAQRNDIPEDLRAAFGENGILGERTTVRELYGLYSSMREIARNAMAGENVNKNTARIANRVAEAILDDLGAVDATTKAGRAINEARAYSYALNKTFYDGAPGRLMKRGVRGAETVEPETALRRTVGRQGPEGMVAARDIEGAAPAAAEDIADFMRLKFVEQAFGPDGTFTQRRAKQWMAANRDLLKRYPDLRKQFAKALSNREAADSFAARAEARRKLVEQGPVSGFVRGQEGKAVLSIIGADDPADAARSVMRAARKDKTGRAVTGVKAAFTDYLIGKAYGPDGLSGRALDGLLKDREIRRAMQEVFTPAEVGRIGYISRALSKLDDAGRDVGAAMNTPANRVVEIAARIVAARQGGLLGGGATGPSLQAANIMSSNAARVLSKLTNDRARELLMDAIDDPELFKDLMTPIGMITTVEDVPSRLIPYLTGTARVQGGNDG